MTSPNRPASTPLTQLRWRIWGGVLFLSLCALAAWWLRPARPEPLVPPASFVPVRVLLAEGEPATQASAWLLQRQASLAEGSWDAQTATLSVPTQACPAAVLVGAPGHRFGELLGISGPTEVTLRPGIEVRLEVEGREYLESDGHRLMLRVRPVPDTNGQLPGGGRVDAAQLVEWIQPLTEAEGGVGALTQEKFGVAMTAQQARAGLRVPAPGRYSIHWGVLAPAQGTWFTLEDRTGKVLGVQDRSTVQTFALRITPETAQQTLEGLKQWIARLEESER